MSVPSNKRIHAEKVEAIFEVLSAQRLSFDRFILSALQSHNMDIKSRITKWLRFCNAVEAGFMSSKSSKRYGPEQTLDALIREVKARGDTAGQNRLNQAIIRHAIPLFGEELDKFCENDSQWLRAASTDVQSCSQLHSNFSPIPPFYQDKLPNLFGLFSLLAGNESETDSSEHEESSLAAVERYIVPSISALLFARNRLINRFQMLAGVLLAVSDPPDLVKSFYIDQVSRYHSQQQGRPSKASRMRQCRLLVGSWRRRM
ncbi:hypothetical protein CF326_g5193 [Tilletia indica]|nr:hypothetical protein CF326_g5193 [Tilletia indica]